MCPTPVSTREHCLLRYGSNGPRILLLPLFSQNQVLSSHCPKERKKRTGQGYETLPGLILRKVS